MKNIQIHVAHANDYLQCVSYVVSNEQTAVLVDPGSGYHHSELLANIQKLGFGLNRVKAVLLTHCHVDHSRGAHLFRDEGIPIYASAKTAEILKRGGHEVWYEFPEHVVPTHVDRILEDGETVEIEGLSIDVLCTPGHTPGSLSFLLDTTAGWPR